jgi:hypothetical protein
MGDLSDFEGGQISGVYLAGTSVAKTATSLFPQKLSNVSFTNPTSMVGLQWLNL